jgi:hypothetical protein
MSVLGHAILRECAAIWLELIEALVVRWTVLHSVGIVRHSIAETASSHSIPVIIYCLLSLVV